MEHRTGSLGVDRYPDTASLLPNGNVLVAGGSVGGNVSDSAEIYDPSMGLWSATTPLLTPRYGHAATVLANGNVLVVGGIGLPRNANGGFSTLSTAELYGAAFPSGTIVPGFTGAWFDPAQRGHGTPHRGPAGRADARVVVRIQSSGHRAGLVRRRRRLRQQHARRSPQSTSRPADASFRISIRARSSTMRGAL